MPTYEYECSKCAHVIEIFQSITAKPKRKPDEPCPGCGERAPIQRLIGGGGAVIFKGSGFYETDYRSEGYKKAAKAEKEAGKSGDDKSGASDSSSKKDAKSKDASKTSTDGGSKSDSKGSTSNKKSA